MKQYFSLKHFAYLLLATGIVIALWYLFFGRYFIGDITKPDSEKAKEIQPFITGLIAPLFTLASTLLVIVTLRNQTRQNFISNFFNLLTQHHKLLDNLSSDVDGISSSESPSTKKDFFDDLSQRIAYDYYELNEECNITVEEYDTKCDEMKVVPNVNINAKNLSGKEKIIKIYDYYFHIHHSDLGHYFRHLYHIVKFIDDQSFDKKAKEQYAGILRAQLSNYEMVLLSYNCLHDYGKDFCPLVIKYNLNKNINDETRLADNYHKKVIDINVLKECFPNLHPVKKKFPFDEYF